MSELYLGVKKVDITPKVGCALAGYIADWYSESIHDNLDATAFVFQQGNILATLISATLCVFKQDLADLIRGRIEAETGIPFANIILTATHTHSGPHTYTENVDPEYIETVVVAGIVDAVKQAKETMQPVTMGYACGESLVGVNRREDGKKNQASLGQCPWGCFDPRMTVVTFKNGEGKIAASLIHYGCHGTSAGLNKEVTQDWPGVMVRRIEELTGATAAFFNGAIGDVGPRITNGRTMGDIHYVEELGGVAAQDATRILKSVTQYTDGDVQCVNSTVALPLKKRLALEEAQEKLKACVKNKYADEIAMKRYYESVVMAYEAGVEEAESYVEEQVLLRVGNLVFVAFAYELFSEISLRIQKECKDLVVLPLSIANGYTSYFPTQSQLCRGGYEIDMFRTKYVQEYVDNADYHLICETLKKCADT